MGTGYALAYRFGITPWERAGKTAEASFSALLDREEVERSRPLGRALDIGCRRGLHTDELATRGWETVGIDNIPRAIDAATRRATSSASFVVADVTDLAAARLGTFDFFLDVGCLHGLSPAQRLAAASGISSLANRDATLLMLAFQPTRTPLIPGGVARPDRETAFGGWDLLRSNRPTPAACPAR